MSVTEQHDASPAPLPVSPTRAEAEPVRRENAHHLPRVKRQAVLPVIAFVGSFVAAYFLLQRGVPLPAAEYLSLAALAALDSVFGGVRARMEHRFRSDVFLSGFLVNMVLAVLLVFVGDKIGVSELYLAAVVTLGGRMFVNLSLIRRLWLERPSPRAQE
jgi:small basic protein